jgi:hypothetical protein
MKKLIALILLVPFILLSGCSKYEKNVNDYYPKVTITSAKLQNDGSVLVTGTVVSEGASKIMYRGFCADTISNPKMISNQIVINNSDSSFTAKFSSLYKSNRYYFRAWAANSYGYAIGTSEIVIDSVFITPPKIPCSLPLDTFTINNTSSTSESIVSQSIANYTEVNITTISHRILIDFKKRPVTGTYTTWQSQDYDHNVTVWVDNRIVDNGSKLYVTDIDNKTFEIAICSMNYYDRFLRDCTSSLRLRVKYP